MSLLARALVSASVVALAGCGSKDDLPAARPRPAASRSGEVTIHVPDRVTSIEIGEGRRVACVSCHSQKTPKPLPDSPDELQEFHVGLTFRHGAQSCGSCHVEGRVDVFRRADGGIIPAEGVIELCSQCHGPQRRDYDHGAHGGMMGYWDLGAGPRTRNGCVDCHEPHAPRIPRVHPVLPPRDRGSMQGVHHGE